MNRRLLRTMSLVHYQLYRSSLKKSPQNLNKIFQTILAIKMTKLSKKTTMRFNLTYKKCNKKFKFL